MMPSNATIYRATFKDLKVTTGQTVQLLQCELTMQLRPLRDRPHLYVIYWNQKPYPVHARALKLQHAKEFARRLFREQLTEWEPIGG